MPRVAKPRWDKGKQVWYANIGEPDAKGRATEVYADKSLGPRDELKAIEWFHLERQRRQPHAVPATSQVTVEMVCEHYLAWAELRVKDGRLAPSEYANRCRHLGIFEDTFAPRVVATLDPDEITEFGERLLADYRPVYVRNICASARLALNWAASKGSAPDGGRMIDANPILGFKSPTVPRAEARYAERKEAAAFLWFLLRSVPRDSPKWPYHRLLLILERCLIRTGARPKEFCRLQWPDIRWKGWKDKSGRWCAKGVLPPDRWKAGKKTGKSRTIYFTPILTRALYRLKDHGAHDPKWVFVHAGGRGGKGADQPWESGSTLSKTIRRHRDAMIAAQEGWRKAIKDGKPVRLLEAWCASVDVTSEGADKLVNYRWRHTAISTLLMLGVDVATVAELTGTSPEMIYRHYGHLLDRHLVNAAETLHTKRLA